MSIISRFFGSLRRGSLRDDIKGRLDCWLHDHRRLAASAEWASGTRSSVRVNQLANSLTSATSYLEIGIERGYTLEAVVVPNRVGVDPHPVFSRHSLPARLAVYRMTSDRYFEVLDDNAVFDIVFLDGLHTFQQTYRDVINSLRHLEAHGAVIIDDVVPSDEISAMPDLERSIGEQVKQGVSDLRWHGDVFRIIPLLRDHHPELHFRTLVGAGNEQTVLWKTDAKYESIAVDEAVLEDYCRVTYEETFAHGVPHYFMPGSDEEVLLEFQRRGVEVACFRPDETPPVERAPQ